MLFLIDKLSEYWNLFFFLWIPIIIDCTDNFVLPLFILYIIHGILILNKSLMYDKVIRNKTSLKDEAFLDEFIEKKWFYKIRAKTVFFLKKFIVVLNWPGYIRYQYLENKISNKNRKENTPFLTIKLFSILSPEPILSEIRFYSLIVIYIFYFYYPTQINHLKFFLYLFCIEIFIRHIVYLIDFLNIFIHLRKTTGNVFYRFIKLIFFDYLSVFLCAFGILKWNSEVKYCFNDIIEVNNFLFNFYKFKQQVFDFKIIPTLNDIFIFAIGFLILNVIKNILRIKEFKRTDEDKKNIALTYAFTGQFKNSLNMIEKLDRIDNEVLHIKIINYVGINDINFAVHCSKKYLTLYLPIDEEKADQNSIYIFIFKAIILFPIQKKSLISLTEEVIYKIDDFSFLECISYLVYHLEITKSDLLDFFKDENNVYRLPYSYCFLLIQSGQINNLKIMLKLLNPCSKIERIYYITFYKSSEILMLIRDNCNEILPILHVYIGELTENPKYTKKFPYSKKMLLKLQKELKGFIDNQNMPNYTLDSNERLSQKIHTIVNDWINEINSYFQNLSKENDKKAIFNSILIFYPIIIIFNVNNKQKIYDIIAKLNISNSLINLNNLDDINDIFNLSVFTLINSILHLGSTGFKRVSVKTQTGF